VDRKRIRIGDVNARRQPLPFDLRRSKDILGLTGRGEKALNGRSVAGGPRAVESVADERERPSRSKAPRDLIHWDGTPVALAFEVGTEIPERQRGVGFALQRLFRQERRRAVDDSRLLFEIQSRAAS